MRQSLVLTARGLADLVAHEHSLFLQDPAGRLRRFRRTLDTMLALTFGTPAQAEQAARRIIAIHDRVQGVLREPTAAFPPGTAYSTHDPALLTWVHATALEIFPRTYEQYVGPLTAEEKDRYCAEATGIVPLLGLPRGSLPTSTAELATGQWLAPPAATPPETPHGPFSQHSFQ